MKHLYIFLIFSVLLVMGSTSASAQETQQETASAMRVAEEQRRLHVADSIYNARNLLADETKRSLKEAERELKDAQNKYKAAKIAHQQASKAAKEAKQSYKLEQKSIKAREKADKQSAKVNQ